jgi:SAM-dependent methyltransferase
MAQITSGVRGLLSHPFVYTLFQYLLGRDAAFQAFERDHVRASAGMTVLDIGCGPADILAYLPEVSYWGFDISADYIESARKRYGNRGTFTRRMLEASDLAQLPSFDRVLAMGIIHHLDDNATLELLRIAHAALKPGGHLITVDGCLEPGQNPIARLLIKADRGQNVRDREGYASLARQIFSQMDVQVSHKSWIPYTHCIMECTR